VISLYGRGLSQAEIAAKLGVNQSTVSRDLNEMRKQSRKTVEEHVVRDALFEYYRWAAAVDEVTKKAWEIAEDEKASQKSLTRATGIPFSS
jgi:predicted transcriptional regulator